MLDLVYGSHDLSRRAKLYHLHGLSFREYLNFAHDFSLESMPLETMLHSPSTCLHALKKVPRILPLLETYLNQGYYPFVLEDPHSYHEKVENHGQNYLRGHR